MAIKIKQNGVWQELALLEQMNILNIELQPSEWKENIGELNYMISIEVPGMSSAYSAIILFNSGQDGLEITAKCTAGALQFYCNTVPTETLEGNIIYSYIGEKVSIYYIGGLTNEDVSQVENQVLQKLPISVVKDGDNEYVEINKMRQLTKADFIRVGQDITVKYDLEGGITMQDSIHLDENDRPESGVSNGVTWTMTWTGF